VVTAERRGAATLLTIDRPERHNAVDGATADALRDAFDAFAQDDDARVLVLTGAGEKAFCTGIDRMEQMGGQSDESTDFNIVGSHGGTPFHFNDPGDNLRGFDNQNNAGNDPGSNAANDVSAFADQANFDDQSVLDDQNLDDGSSLDDSGSFDDGGGGFDDNGGGY